MEVALLKLRRVALLNLRRKLTAIKGLSSIESVELVLFTVLNLTP